MLLGFSRYASALRGARLPRPCCSCRSRMVVFRAFQDGLAQLWERSPLPTLCSAFKLTLVDRRDHRGANTVFGVVSPLARAAHVSRGAVRERGVDLPLALSPVVVGLALFLLYGEGGWFGGLASRAGSRCCSPCRHGARDDLRHAAVRRARGRPGPARDRDGAGAGGRVLGASPFQVFRRVTLPAIRWGVVYGVVLTPRGRSGSSGRSASSRAGSRARRDDDACASRPSGKGSTVAAYAASCCSPDRRSPRSSPCPSSSPSEPGGRPMGITVLDVSKRFNDFVALDDVSLSIASGPSPPCSARAAAASRPSSE